MAECQNTSRRTILKGVSALGAGSATALAGCVFPHAVAAKPGAGDPVLPLYREWLLARKEWTLYADMSGNGEWDWPESVAAERRENAALRAMVETEPTSVEGIAALAHVLWDLEGPFFVEGHPENDEIANSHTNRLISAIWRASTGRIGLPRDAVA